MGFTIKHHAHQQDGANRLMEELTLMVSAFSSSCGKCSTPHLRSNTCTACGTRFLYAQMQAFSGDDESDILAITTFAKNNGISYAVFNGEVYRT